MRSMIFVSATYAGDKISGPNGDDRITLHALVDGNDRLIRQRFFGFQSNKPDGYWPFILQAPIQGRKGQLDWGSDSDPSDTNIFDKAMRPGEQFTVWPHDEENKGAEWVYGIDRTHDLVKE